MTARIAKHRLVWILPLDRQAARRRRHDKRQPSQRDMQHLLNVSLSRMVARFAPADERPLTQP